MAFLPNEDFNLSNVTIGGYSDLIARGLTMAAQLSFLYSINQSFAVITNVGSGTATQANAMAKVATGTTTGSSSEIRSLGLVKVWSGSGAVIRFNSIFSAPDADGEILIGAISTTDGVAIGYDGTDFGFLIRSNSIDNFISQSTWNKDKLDGTGKSGITLDPTKGNLWQINIEGFGFNGVVLEYRNSDSGEWITCHYERFANSVILPNFERNAFPLCLLASNGAGTADVWVKSVSLSGLHEGEYQRPDPRFGQGNEKTISTLTNVITIKNPTTFLGVGHVSIIRLDFLAIASDGSKNVHLKVYYNATLGGTPVWNDVATGLSVAQYDIVGTTITGGVLITDIPLSKVDSTVVPLSDYRFRIPPGTQVTFAAHSASNNDVSVGLSWSEEV